ncbi:MAG: putative ATP/GTP-binding protein [Amycolatopsis sp.]|uniref:hypothetical protein n=1 Tax=Amycolatopsis sp. TaxID=37632 RepID=UPI0026176B4A|nr:hypothetical protein [Amycolatopsis sp.]MCU1680231.1 putative ATP/GTP-binding protein [Amycolatopsis sp.]
MRRIATITGIVALSMLGVSAPALADGWGSTICSQVPSPACDLGAGAGGGNGKPGGNPGDSKPGHPGTGNPGNGSSNSNPGDTLIGGKSNLASCSYVKSDFQPPPSGVVTAAYTRPLNFDGATVQPAVFTRSIARTRVIAQPVAGPAPEQKGSWYVWHCSTPGMTDALFRAPVWIPDGQQPGAAQLPSPAELAQMAYKQLRLPTPSIAANPAGEQLVNLPTWMWLSSGWGPVSATATVPGVTVTATATPTSVSWSMGDGSTVTCTGAGSPFHPGSDPKAASPDCGHTYRTSSASQAGEAFPVSATVHWTVTWAGAGLGGVFPGLTTTGNAAFRVAESQALNNGG